MYRCSKSINKPSGFTLIETILALFCISLSILIITPCLNVIKTQAIDIRRNDDRIAVHQLRLLLAQSHTFDHIEQELTFMYQNKMNRLMFDRRRLVRKDGYEIFLEDVDDIAFLTQDRCISLVWRRKEQTYEAILACQ